MNSLTAKEIEELRGIVNERCGEIRRKNFETGADWLASQFSRLLSMLPPALPADVAEAREHLESVTPFSRITAYPVSISELVVDADALRLLLDDHARLAGELDRVRHDRDVLNSLVHRISTENAAQAERIKRLKNDKAGCIATIAALKEESNG